MSSQIRAPQVRVADHVGSENAASTRNATATSSIAKRKLEDSTGTTVKRPALTSAVAPRTTRTALPAAPTRPPTTRTFVLAFFVYQSINHKNNINQLSHKQCDSTSGY
jgi:hypothetical protein